MVHNLLAPLSRQLPAELSETLLAREGIRIERIVSHGHASPTDFWYDQPEDEWVLVVQGAAKLTLAEPNGAERTVDLKTGDYLLLPAHQRHRVEWTTPDEPTIWLAVFLQSSASPLS